MRVVNLENNNRKFTKSIGNFHVLEYIQDASVSPMNAVDEYFMSKMNVRRRQVVIDIDRDHSAVIQAGAMQWMGGNVQATSGVKGIGDLFGKAIKGAVTKETAVKPEYVGEGTLVLEPTYKYIILQDVSMWGANGMTIEDGMFLACDSKVKRNVVARKNLSSAVLGGEGLLLWSSIFVTLLANKINLFCASTLAVSATLDTRAEGCCQVFTDGDELKNRFLFQAPSEWESLTSLCSGVKGMPLRDGCVLTSGSKS